MAGGEGRRLEPYSRVLPKPLWPVGDLPIVEILIRQLYHNGIKDIILAVGHQAGLIQIVLGDGSRYGAKLRYVIEKKPLGTVGPLNRIKNLDDDFLVLNGDLLTDLNFRELIRTHFERDSIATIAACRRAVDIDFGVIIERGNIINDYKEKPIIRHLVSSGIYAFNKGILKYIPKKKYDFPDLVNRLIRAGQNPTVHKFKGHWLDIGRMDDWEKADKLFRKKRRLFLKNA
jgi:NDP-sugar pyrophosphorylase family protein